MGRSFVGHSLERTLPIPAGFPQARLPLRQLSLAPSAFARTPVPLSQYAMRQ